MSAFPVLGLSQSVSRAQHLILSKAASLRGWTALSHRPRIAGITFKGGEMAKQPANHGKAWTPEQAKQLEKLADQNTPTRVMGLKLGRTEDSVRNKASELGVSLKPTNQSPYNRRKA